MTRILTSMLILAGLTSAAFGANVNFVIKTKSPHNATYAAQAERYYKNVSAYWFGKSHPVLWKPVELHIKEGQIGAGGATTFTIDEKTGHVYNFTMSIQGSRERLLDSVIPHEVNHVVLYTIIRRRFSRYFDEGAATLWEHPVELANQHATLRKNMHRLKPSKLWMDRLNYPSDMQDVLLFYAQGYMSTKFLVDRFGPEKFITFLKDKRRPTQKFRDHFGMSPDQFDSYCIAQYRKEFGTGQTARHRIPVTRESKLKKRRVERIVIVFQADFNCPPCTAFKVDLRNNKFKKSGFKFIQVTAGTKEFRKYEAELRARRGHGVKAYPSFWVYKTKHVRKGYDGPKSFVDFLLLIPRAILSAVSGILGHGPGSYVPPGNTAVEIAEGAGSDLLELKNHMLEMKSAGVLGKIALIPKLKEDKRKLTGDIKALREKLNEHGGIVGTLKKEVVGHAVELLDLGDIRGNVKDHVQNLKGIHGDLAKVKEAVGPVDKLKAGVKLLHDGNAERKALMKSHDSQNGLSGSGIALALASTVASMFAGRHVRHTAGKVDEVHLSTETGVPVTTPEPTGGTEHSTPITI